MAKYNGMLPLVAVVMLLCVGVANATTCAAGFKDCDKNYYLNGCEVNIHTDVNNCGDCGVNCLTCANAVASCKAAKCEYACKAPWMNCDNTWTNGCEVDVSKDVSNCGACGTKCLKDLPNAETKCENHKCVYSCKAGFANCNNKWEDGCETEVTKNVNACGACGARCTPASYTSTPICRNSKCEYSCAVGWKNCDGNTANGCEADVSKDVKNCGACGAKCMKDLPNVLTKCENHKCVYICKAGWANCNNKWEDGCECNPGTDVNHCGGCGKKCSQPKYAGGEAKCSYGRCETQSCKRGMRYDGGRKCCVNEGDNNGGNNGGNHGGNNGGNNGGNHGGNNGGNNGGNDGGKGGKGGNGGH